MNEDLGKQLDEYQIADAVQEAHEDSHDASGFDPYQFIDALAERGMKVVSKPTAVFYNRIAREPEDGKTDRPD
jgi:hypothetical protein